MPKVQDPNGPAPTLVRPIALVLLIWHAGLGADYVVARFAMDMPGWPAIMPALPLSALWLTVAWSMAVWLGALAALFLILRDNASVLLFFAAAVAQLAVTVGLRGADGAVFGLPIPAFTALCILPPLAGWIYARTLNRRGLLH